MTVLDLAKEKVLLLDGAMGTALHALGLPEDAYDGAFGCSEILVRTVPDKIRDIHRGFLAAGSDVVETNTFGATPLVLGEYGLQVQTEELNRWAARLAREAVEEFSTPDRPRFVAGSVGPGTKLATLGQTTYETMHAGYSRQIAALLETGVDLLLIETCQDLLQTKAALAAAMDGMARTRRVPIYVSVTIEQTGTLLTGSDMGAVMATLAPFPIDILGMNCATGPVPMRPHLEELAKHWNGLTGVYPNAGIPVPGPEGVRFPERPAEFSKVLGEYVRAMNLNVVGGCCGTTPDHIRALADAIDGVTPKPRDPRPGRAISSLFYAVDLKQDPPPLYFGERANATGSKAFRDALLASDYDRAFDILAEQEEHGSHAADLSVAYAGRDEMADMETLVTRAARECKLPLMIDSNIADVVDLALRRYPGRAVINSINLEDGGERAKVVCPMARRYGAALVALTIDEQSMAMTADHKVAVAKRLVTLCEDTYGLAREDLLIDALTFTIGSGDPSLRTAAMETLEAIRRIKEEIPGVRTLLGLSNVSFGLSLKSRRVLNSVFLDLCLKAGLDAAILNPKHIAALPDLDAEDIRVAENLIFNRDGGGDPLEAFIHHFQGKPDDETDALADDRPPAESVREGIVKGKTRLIEEPIRALLGEQAAEDILNDILVPAMKHVGDLFGQGVLQLPFVLKSAEAMKRAVDIIKPHFKAEKRDGASKKLLLATVRGDVHDIGKNLVNIIVSNNGFETRDIGTKVPLERILAEAKDFGADAIGMSGLLVSSALVMAENLRAMSDQGITTPVLVGGAALTHDFVQNTLKPAYSTGALGYCRDAFDGLVAMQHLAEGKAPPDPAPPPKAAVARSAFGAEPLVIENIEPPTPPFWGSRVVDDVPVDAIFEFINEVALFRGRWGFKRGKMDADAYKELVEKEVRPKYTELRRLVKAEKLFTPKIAYGYFRGRSDGDDLIVEHDGGEKRFHFPRRREEPTIAVPDFFRADDDLIAFLVVTLGDGAAARGQELLGKEGYQDYFLLHGLATEVTDALAEYGHALMRHELGIGEKEKLDWQALVTQKYRGSRYAFGYPACPDLAQNAPVMELVGAERIGVTLTEEHQMVPEFSTSAIVAHHPKAKYFAV